VRSIKNAPQSLAHVQGISKKLRSIFFKEIQDFYEVFIVVLQKKQDEYLVVYGIDCNFAEKSE
jgi:hypothetical protein